MPAVSGRIPREDLREVVTGYHVLRGDRGWVVRGVDARRATAEFETKAEAVAYARDLGRARNAQVIVHNTRGEVERTDSFGDPVEGTTL